MKLFSFLIFSEEQEFGSEIDKQILATGEADVVARVSDPDQLMEALKSKKPDGLFVDLGHGSHVSLDILEAMPALPALTVVSGLHGVHRVRHLLRNTLGALEPTRSLVAHKRCRDTLRELYRLRLCRD